MTTTETYNRARAAIAAATTADAIDGIRKRIAATVEAWKLTDDEGGRLDQLAVRRLAELTGTTTADTVAAPATNDREIVPEGEQAMQIVRYDRGIVSWKVTEKNPSGECHRIRLQQGDRAFVFEDIPTTLARIVKGIEADIGVSLASSVGREVRVEIKHITTRAGETRAVVGRWLTSTSPAAKAAATKPTASVKPSRNAVDHPTDDDVSF